MVLDNRMLSTFAEDALIATVGRRHLLVELLLVDSQCLVGNVEVSIRTTAVALLGETNPVGILFAAFLFSMLQTGSGNMSNIDNIPPQIVQIVTATIIFFIAVKYIIEKVLPNIKKKGEKA